MSKINKKMTYIPTLKKEVKSHANDKKSLQIN